MAGERLNPSIADLNDEYRRTGLPILTISEGVSELRNVR
jgi:hypothetical protein